MSLGNREESTSGITPKKFMHEDFYGGLVIMQNDPERCENVSQENNFLKNHLIE